MHFSKVKHYSPTITFSLTTFSSLSLAYRFDSSRENLSYFQSLRFSEAERWKRGTWISCGALHLATTFNQTDLVFILMDSGASMEYSSTQMHKEKNIFILCSSYVAISNGSHKHSSPLMNWWYHDNTNPIWSTDVFGTCILCGIKFMSPLHCFPFLLVDEGAK